LRVQGHTSVLRTDHKKVNCAFSAGIRGGLFSIIILVALKAVKGFEVNEEK
jgi:hypothetical protein